MRSGLLAERGQRYAGSMKYKLRTGSALASAGIAAIALVASGTALQETVPRVSEGKEAMQVQYLEIVTPEVDATCDALETLHGVTFSKPEAGLGNARTAALAGGGRIGVRAPMRATEEPVVRPYVLVDDIEAAVEAARAAGGEIAHPPLEIPGHGRFAIYVQGGIQHGLWQL